MNIRVISVVLIFTVSGFTSGAILVLFKRSYFGGQIYEGEITENCTNLTGGADDAASSVHTDGSCIILYEDANCEGRSIRIAPGTPYHHALSRIGFQAIASSFRGCRNTSSDNDFEIDGNGALLMPNRTRYIHLFSRPQFQGFLYEGAVSDDCTNLPRADEDIATSIDTDGACVYLYEHRNCQGRRKKVEPGSPAHSNLTQLCFDKMASSFKSCGSDEPSSGAENSGDKDAREKKYIYLYEDVNFSGCIEGTAISEACINVPSGNYSGVNTMGSCVYVYDELDCEGRRLRMAPGTLFHHDLSQHCFDKVVRSIRECPEEDKDTKPKQAPAVSTASLKLYSKLHREGCYFESELSETCTNIPNKVAFGADTEGKCVYLFDEPHCQGRSLRLNFGEESHHDLEKSCFDIAVRSFRACDEVEASNNKTNVTDYCNVTVELENGSIETNPEQHDSGDDVRPARKSPQDLSSNTWLVVTVVVVLIVLGLIFLASGIGAIFFYRQYREMQAVLRRLTPEEVQEFFEGRRDSMGSDVEGSSVALSLPFTRKLSPESIEISMSEVLGSGHFGVVYKGLYAGQPVAVKTFKRTVEIEEFKAVLAEAKIMAYIGDHPHVVNFIGAEVTNIMDRKIMLVSELSPYGDLLSFIQRSEVSEDGGTIRYLNLESHAASTITPKLMARWCAQIASAMEHVERKNVVHGDLAARNILVFDDLVVKITDFGLSKQLYSSSEYLLKRKRALPWRWAAIELLTRLEFSTETDVWAFGVTAWEIYSCGRQPYGGIVDSDDLVQFLQSGKRMEKPAFSDELVYKMILECWNPDRNLRPRFSMLDSFFTAVAEGTLYSSHLKLPAEDAHYKNLDDSGQVSV